MNTTTDAPEPEAGAQGDQDARGQAQEAIAETTTPEGNSDTETPTEQPTDRKTEPNVASEPEEDPQAQSAPTDAEAGETGPQTSPLAERPLKDLTVEELRTLYIETIERNTSSVHHGYLI